MDEQTANISEPTSTIPEPVVINTPITEPIPIEATEVPIEPISAPTPEKKPEIFTFHGEAPTLPETLTPQLPAVEALRETPTEAASLRLTTPVKAPKEVAPTA